MPVVSRVPADRTIVTRFVEYLSDERRPDLKVENIRWPEDENPGQSEIEAIVGDLAIEHTSIDTIPEQRRDGEWFEAALAAVGRLSVPFRLQIQVPYELVRKGADWPAFEAGLVDWITNVAPGLPDGNHEFNLAATPLRLAATKSSNLKPGVFLRRPAPDDNTLPARVGDQIRRKLKKRALYKARHTTVLLLESKDQALMNQYKMLEAAREGIGGSLPEGLDQLWYAEAEGAWFFDFTAAILNGTDELG